MMIKRSAKILFFAWVVSSFATVFSQEYTDFGTNLGVEINKSITKRFDVNLDGEFRTKNNVSDIDRFMVGVGTSYSLIRKYLKIGVAYNLMADNDVELDYYNWRHRFNAQLSGRYDVQRFSFRLRSRYQLTYRDESVRRYNWNPRQYWRNKLSVSYKVPKVALSPFLSCEVFYQLNNYKGNVFDEVRYEAGVEYQFNKRHALELSCRYDDAMNVVAPENKVLLGLLYKFSF